MLLHAYHSIKNWFQQSRNNEYASSTPSLSTTLQMCLLESVWTCNQLFGLVISASCMKCGNQKAHIHFGAKNCLHTQLHTVHAWLLYSQSYSFIKARYIFTQVHAATQLGIVITQLHTVHAWLLYSNWEFQSLTHSKEPDIVSYKWTQLHIFIRALCRAYR